MSYKGCDSAWRGIPGSPVNRGGGRGCPLGLGKVSQQGLL